MPIRVTNKYIASLLIAVLTFTFTSTFTSFAAPKKPKKKMEEKKAPVGDKPDVTTFEPRGLQTGKETVIKLIGTNLTSLTAVKFNNSKITVILDPDKFESPTIAWIKVKAAADLARGTYDLTLENAAGPSTPVKVSVDELPQVQESDNTKSVSLPVSFWGTINPMGDTDEIQFQARIGQTLTFDLASKSLGSKLEATLSIIDAKGTQIADARKFDGGDPFIAHTFKEGGTYRARIADADAAGSTAHFYRLTMGELPTVVGIFPLAVTKGREQEITLLGYNLGTNNKVKLKPAMTGEADIPVAAKLRPHRAFKVMVTDQPELVESSLEPVTIPVPGAVSGCISKPDEADLYRFQAKAGQHLVLETSAARRGCPTDTKIEILWPDNQPVKRFQLQSVRNSSITFRDIDSVDVNARVENWQEMELNEYLYMQGEVCRIFRMPEGPDSGFQFYKSAGKREDYFDSSATTHALDEICYIVEPRPPEEKLAANGLPVFPIYYVNDDDAERELGSDSRLAFTVPKDGLYLVRVTDSRSHGGDRYAYRLNIREAHPDFNVTINGLTPTVSPGSGQEFTMSADRIDGFDGPITVEITDMPKGFAVSSPIVIQAGHLEASGTINAETNAIAPTAEALGEIKASATARIQGAESAKSIKAFSSIKLGAAPTLLVAFEPYDEHQTNFTHHALTNKPVEITIAPGETVPVWLKIERHGHEELATFTAENLPHGVIIDNIGLNGVLIAKGDNARQIFLRAAKWVPETDRLFYVQAKQAGVPTSQPVLLHVRKPKMAQTVRAQN